jgi:tetratricopeptide (TPR) repeat protein
MFGQVTDFQKEFYNGVLAYENSSFRESILHFEHAVALDPKSVDARLYLAGSYNEQYCFTCEFDSEVYAQENDRLRVLAVATYEKVLELDPTNVEATISLGLIYRWHAEREKATAYLRRTIEVDQENFDALYALGVVDWEESYQSRTEAQVGREISSNAPIIGRRLCKDMRERNSASVKEGLAVMQKALRLSASWEPMDYLSLLYREHAQLQCGDRVAYENAIRVSDSWARRACEARNGGAGVSIPARLPPAQPPPPKYAGDDCTR